MVVVGNVGDVKEHLMIDGVDLHAVIFLIALMFYSHSLAIGPASSLARGPPTKKEVAPMQKGGRCVCGRDRNTFRLFVL
jgi:hypothetical protein